MEQTAYYKLNLPSGEDYFNIAHQNENMERLDTALAARIGVGSFVGNGERERHISLSRAPSFVLLLREGSRIQSDGARLGGLAVKYAPATAGDVAYLTLTDTGFSLTHLPDTFDGENSTHANSDGVTYLYLWG